MNLGDRLSSLRLPLLGARRDPAEEQRLLKLYWNRAELKKERAALDDQLHQLRDRVKQQEAAIERGNEQLESLETLLGNPELAFGALVHFHLRALWRACHAQLEQFGSELRRQQEERERKRQLADFQQDRQARVQLAVERLTEASAALEQEQATLADHEARLRALTGFWNYFRRRALAQALGAQRTRVAAATRHVELMQDASRTVEKEPWPEFQGISLEGRRAINVAVIAYAQLLYARLAESGLAAQARSARLKTVQEASHGTREQCMQLMTDIAAALAQVRSARDVAGGVRERSEALRAAVSYRSEHEAVPDAVSLPSAFAGRGGGVSVREPNVLGDDYWDVYKVLLH